MLILRWSLLLVFFFENQGTYACSIYKAIKLLRKFPTAPMAAITLWHINKHGARSYNPMLCQYEIYILLPFLRETWRKESPHGSDNGAGIIYSSAHARSCSWSMTALLLLQLLLFKPTNLFKYNFVAYVSTELIRHEYNLIFFNITDVQEQTYQ